MFTIIAYKQDSSDSEKYHDWNYLSNYETAWGEIYTKSRDLCYVYCDRDEYLKKLHEELVK